ncbi:hypothetical protein FACS1894109_04610 [Spirochaetia bacterium]|nr:hypothetical protein FACS1894109_04610 [Spirochaetia bacterium]
MKNFFKLFGVIAMVAIIGIGLAGCDPNGDGDGDPDTSIAVTGNVEAKTLTLTITASGATWQEGSASRGEDVVNDVCPVTQATGDIRHRADVNYADIVSADKKTLTLTVSKQGNRTGTITFTPKTSSIPFSTLGYHMSNPSMGTITGNPVTFTID